MRCGICGSKEVFVCYHCYLTDIENLQKKIEELERKIQDLEERRHE